MERKHPIILWIVEEESRTQEERAFVTGSIANNFMCVCMYIYVYIRLFCRRNNKTSGYGACSKYFHICVYVEGSFAEDVGSLVHCNTLQTTATHCNTLQLSSFAEDNGSLLQKTEQPCYGAYCKHFCVCVRIANNFMCVCVYIYIYVEGSTSQETTTTLVTGWQRIIECLKLQIIFRTRATNHRALSQKMNSKDKASYDSTPLCTGRVANNFMCVCVSIYVYM